MSSEKKILIVGGGIGGLSSGIALAERGFRVEIAEIQREYNVYGVGIIQPVNALRALDSLELADEAMRRGSAYGKVKMCSESGFPFAEVGMPPIGRLPSHNGISRKILHEILFEACLNKGVQFRMGMSVSQIDNKTDGLAVQFTDDSKASYDLMIGADGLHSKIRAMALGEFKPKYTGQSVWRYAFKRHPQLDTGYIFMGKKTKAGLIPMTADSMYMFLVSAEGDDNPKIPENELVPRMKAWLAEYTAPMILDVVGEIKDPNGVIYRPLETLLVPAPWHKGKVILIGDAVHATIPQLGQGAGLALEDSIVLAELLSSEKEMEKAFGKFMERRFARCKMIVEVSEKVGELEQLGWKGQLPEGVNLGAIMGQALGAMMQPI